jgi:DNA repair protein RadC
METKVNASGLYNVAEVELFYKSKVKASQRPQICSSKDAYSVLRQLSDDNKIEFVEQFKVLFLNKANKILGVHMKYLQVEYQELLLIHE